MAKGQFDIAITRTGIKKARAVKLALGNDANKLANTDFAKFELGFGYKLTLAVHHVGIAEYLLVHGCDDLLLLGVFISWNQFKGSFALRGEALNAE